MDACAARGGEAAGGHGRVCWFCGKGRHGDCMGRIPVQGGPDGGPHDCAFDTGLVACGCCGGGRSNSGSGSGNGSSSGHDVSDAAPDD